MRHNLFVWEVLALFGCGTFFGAAVYISLAQHPAALEAGVPTAARFFPPMYRRAAAMQVALAVVGTVAGIGAWWAGSGLPWLVGASLLFAVVPFTLLVIKPVNNRLLNPDRDPSDADTETLLHRWGLLHAARSVLSGVAFLVFLLLGR